MEINDREDLKDITSPSAQSDRLILLKNYTIVEQDNDVTLIYIDAPLNMISATILSCNKCFLAPTYKKYANAELPPSLSRRFSIYCPRCNPKPISMFTLEGMIGYYNVLRK